MLNLFSFNQQLSAETMQYTESLNNYIVFSIKSLKNDSKIEK